MLGFDVKGIDDFGDLDLLVQPDWQMSNAERAALVLLASHLQPRIAVEVGTADGGSLAALARHSGHVYTIDVDPTCQQRLGDRFDNVTFITGDSTVELPALLDRLTVDGRSPVGLILIDGDHTAEGVARDIAATVVRQTRRWCIGFQHELTDAPMQPLADVAPDVEAVLLRLLPPTSLRSALGVAPEGETT